MNHARFGCLTALAIVAWTALAIPVAIILGEVIPGNVATSFALLAAGAGAYLTIGRFRGPVPPSQPGSDRLVAGPSGIPAPADRWAGAATSVAATGEPPTPGTAPTALALEAQRAIAQWRPPAVERPSEGSKWRSRLAGAVAGGLLVWVYVFLSGPDGGEAVFGLTVLTMIGSLLIGPGMRKLDSRRLSLVGEAILGLGVGTAIGVASLFVAAVVSAALTGQLANA